MKNIILKTSIVIATLISHAVYAQEAPPPLVNIQQLPSEKSDKTNEKTNEILINTDTKTGEVIVNEVSPKDTDKIFDTSKKTVIYLTDPSALSGDTIKSNNTLFRLNYIDSPHTNNICYLGDVFLSQKCGNKSKRFLDSIISQNKVKCVLDSEIDNGYVANCYINDKEDLSRIMILNGYAKVLRNLFPDIYQKEEDEAKFFRKGLWKY